MAPFVHFDGQRVVEFVGLFLREELGWRQGPDGFRWQGFAAVLAGAEQGEELDCLCSSEGELLLGLVGRQFLPVAVNVHSDVEHLKFLRQTFPDDLDLFGFGIESSGLFEE